MLRSFKFLMGLIVVALLSSCIQADESKGILEDGEFNLATSGTNVSNTAWGLLTNRPDGAAWSSQFEFSGFARSDGDAGSGGGLWYRPFEGRQGGSSDPIAESVLTQSASAAVAGDYILSVDWAREEFFNATQWDITLTSAVFGGDTQTVTYNLLTAPSIGDGDFNDNLAIGGPNVAHLIVNNVAVDAVLTVTVTMMGGTDINNGSTEQSGYLDNFNLRAVPEPSSTALLLLGSLGFAGLRRRKSA